MVKNGPKRHPKVFKTHFQPIFGVYIHSRPFFEKSKKIDFWKFFSDHASTKSAEFHFPVRKSAKYYWGSKKHIGAPFRKISFKFVWGFPVSTIKNIYIDQFGQNPILTLRSFWLQKSIKNVKIFIFSKSSTSQLSANIYIYGYICNR